MEIGARTVQRRTRTAYQDLRLRCHPAAVAMAAVAREWTALVDSVEAGLVEESAADKP